METNEIRINNYVKDEFGSVIKVTPDNISQLLQNSDNIKPIELDFNWLENLGFKKELYELDNDDDFYYVFDINNDSVFCDLTIIGSEDEGNFNIALFPYEQWFKYKYVHELQNLFFGITKKELNLDI